jgi:hypothetical protein
MPKLTAVNRIGETFSTYSGLIQLSLYTIQAFDRDGGFTVTDETGRHVADITSGGSIRLVSGELSS